MMNGKLMFGGERCVRTAPIRAPTPVGASQGCTSLVAHRSERNFPKRRFSFCELFLFAPLASKRKSGLTAWIALFLQVYSGFVRHNSELRFLLTQKAQKKAHKENAECLRAQEVAFCKKLRKNLSGLGECEHTPRRETIIYRFLILLLHS